MTRRGAEVKRIDPVVWTDDDHALWARIAAHDFESGGAVLTFAGRLARDHGWSLDRARAAIEGYRRFCFLAMRSGCDVTPSEEIDEVWHQHLTYSRDYWQVWCPTVLRRDLHHGPTTGTPEEARRFATQYADTLAAHEAWFGPPTSDLWPGTAERFGRRRFGVIDHATHVALRVPCGALTRWRRLARALPLGALLTLLLTRPASASPLNVLDWTAAPFLTFFVAAAGLSIAAAMTLPPRLSNAPTRPSGRARLSPMEIGFLAGGAARASDVLILEDIAAGRIVQRIDVRKLGPLTSRTDVLVVGEQIVKRAWLVSEKSDEVDDLRRGLVEDGLIPSDAEHRTRRRTVSLVIPPVVLLGLAKLGVGLERGKPVGFLIFALVATALLAFVLTEARSRMSDAGRTVLAAYGGEHARALRAPRSEEVIAAFAVAGASALVGTAFEAYGRMLKNEDGTGGDAGGCGGGGCGCGCGGCGG